MKYVYRNTKEDYVEFNMVVSSNTKPGKRNMFINRMIMAILFYIFVMAGIILHVTEIHFFKISDLIYYVLFALLAIFWFFYYPYLVKRSMSKNLDKMSKQGKMPYNKELSIELLDDKIIENSEMSQVVLPYTEVYKIIKTENLIIVMNSVVSGFIVPIRCLNGDEIKVLEFLKEKGCKIIQ